MPSPIRLAFVAALAAFALGACSGGGGMTTPPVDTTDFFPIPAEHVAMTKNGNSGDLEYIATGKTLSNLIREEITRLNVPQFSVFEFGAAETANGIPLQKSRPKTEDGRYAAVAYQAVLEHSMMLVQGGVYRFAVDGVTAARAGGVEISTGVPTTGDPVAGTWTGKAIGFEWSDTPDGRPTYDINAGQAERRIVQADVEIGVTLNGNDQSVTWAFTDWTGGSVQHPDFTSEGTSLRPPTQGFPAPQTSEGDHYLVYSGGSPSRVVAIRFYGPARQEAGGTFEFSRTLQNPAIAYSLEGAFAARKQDE